MCIIPRLCDDTTVKYTMNEVESRKYREFSFESNEWG